MINPGHPVFKLLILPPGINFLLMLGGALLFKSSKRFAKVLFFSGLVSLYLFSTPLVSSRLMHGLEIYPPLSNVHALPKDIGAIVVPSAAADYAPEYGEKIIYGFTLQRVLYAAWLYQQTHLPILVTGGVGAPPIAIVMAKFMRQVLHVPVVWEETKSNNSFQNAEYSAKILKAHHISKILLVSNAFDAKRFAWSFRKQGLKVIPAPTVFVGDAEWLDAREWLPAAEALRQSYYAMYEYMGNLWYWLRY